MSEGMVAPQPVPMGWQITTLPGQKAVVVQLMTPVGIFVTFWDPTGARKFISDLEGKVKECESGLVLPASGLIVGT